MEFRKKLKLRLYTALCYIAVGIAMIAVGCFIQTDNSFISSFGFVLAVMGAARVRNYLIITKNEESVRKREIVETDERNINIINRSRSAAFYIYILLSGAAVVILSLVGARETAVVVSYSLAALVLIYWVCYWIYQKRS